MREATKGRGIGHEPSNPRKCSEVADRVTRKSEGSIRLSLLCAVDKMYRKDVLAFAYQCCRANGGAAGADGQTFEDIEAYGLERWLDELAQELKSRTYRPLPVRRGYIPKPDGRHQRTLGVPAIRDRVAQT